MEAKALDLAKTIDYTAAVEYLISQDDMAEAVQTFNKLQRHCYWQEKNLTQSIAFGRAGIQHALGYARRIQSSDPAVAIAFVGRARALCFNLGSFSWAGWDEEGIEVSATDATFGLDAAKTCLRLVREEGKDEGQALWLVGAHSLAAKDLRNAREHFTSSREAAEKKIRNRDSF